MLSSPSTMASQQAQPTELLYSAVLHFLQNATTHPEAQLRYSTSKIQLRISSDASYLSETNGRPRAAGIHYLSDATAADTDPPNGAIEVISPTIPTVVSAVSEAELVAAFLNG